MILWPFVKSYQNSFRDTSSELKLFGQKFSTHFHVIGHLYSRWECGTSSILQTRIQGHRSLHQPSSILWNRLWSLYINQTPNNLWSWTWGGTLWNLDEKLHQIYQTWNTTRQRKWAFHTFRCRGKQNEVRHVLHAFYYCSSKKFLEDFSITNSTFLGTYFSNIIVL